MNNFGAVYLETSVLYTKLRGFLFLDSREELERVFILYVHSGYLGQMLSALLPQPQEAKYDCTSVFFLNMVSVPMFENVD